MHCRYLRGELTVASLCNVTATALAFGTYTGALLTGTGTVSITCTQTTPYNVGLGAGIANGATVTTRQMTSGSYTIGYILTSDEAHGVDWGVTVGTNTVAGTGTVQPLAVYGQIAAGQYVTPGAYANTVTATVSY